MVSPPIGLDSNRRPKIVFRPYSPADAHQAQAMIQGSGFSSLSFNIHAGNIIFLAIEGHSIKAIATAHIDYSDKNTLILGDCYLRGGWDNDDHLAELHIALKLWAQQQYGVQSFKRNDYESVNPIGIQEIMNRAATNGFTPEMPQHITASDIYHAAVPA